MRVLEGDPAGWPAPNRRAAATIGVYDGVHLGHQAVIRSLADRSADLGLDLTVVTFRQHPAAVLAPERVPPQLTTLGQRLERFAALGVDQVALLEFDDQLRQLSPRDFVRIVLVDGLTARLVSVGSDFRFGYGQAGDVELLAGLGEEYDFLVEPIDLVGAAEPFGATRIRRALVDGDLAAVERALGRRFSVRGEVIYGDGRGRTIGFPTANLALEPHQALPARGVYAVWVHLDGEQHRGVANIGVRPTFDGVEEMLEVHLLDVVADLYGEMLEVEFVARIRGERRFEGVDALVAQIRKDAVRSGELLNAVGA